MPAMRAATRSRICLRMAISTAVSFMRPGLGIWRRLASASSGVRREGGSARRGWRGWSAGGPPPHPLGLAHLHVHEVGEALADLGEQPHRVLAGADALEEQIEGLLAA